jgi:hypothetical protein
MHDSTILKKPTAVRIFSIYFGNKYAPLLPAGFCAV